MKILRGALFGIFFSIFAMDVAAQPTIANDSDSPFRITHFKEGGVSFYYSGYAFSPTLSYWFRMNYYEFNEFLSLSASCPVSFAGYFSSYYGGRFSIDLPITADINFGNRANDITEFPIGGFVGIGGAFNLMMGFGNSISYGPLLHGGFRAAVAGRPFTLRASYLFGIGGVDLNSSSVDANPNVLGVGIFYSL